MDPITPNKGKGAPVVDEPTDVVRVGDDTRMVVAQYELAPGTTLGEYQIEGFLGGGGMGEVFTAVHPKIGKRAAVKVIKKDLSTSFNVERFMDEARVVNTIGHPNIVDIFAFGEMPDGRCYYVMELLVGESLRERIARGPIDNEEVCAILKPLTRALDAAHNKGVIHRDLKPDNVFLVAVPGEKPNVKLLDFGIAKLAKADHRVEQTKSGVMVGTPQYVAPEQAKGREIDHRADIYALGGITFEMLTGRPPFEADNAMEMVAKHLMEPPVKPSSVNPDVTPELDSLVVAMLAKDPMKRPALADIALVIDRIKAGPISMEDARTLSYAPNAQASHPSSHASLQASQQAASTLVPSTPKPSRLPTAAEVAKRTPVPITPPIEAPYATPAITQSEAYVVEPQSGAHTAVEVAVTELTDKEAVTIKPSRGLWIGVSIAVLGVAAIVSFLIVKLLAGDSRKEDSRKEDPIAVSGADTAMATADATAATADVASSTADAAPNVEPIDLDAGVPAVVVDAAPEVVDAAVAIAPDAKPSPPTRPERPRPQPPRMGKVTIVVANAPADTVILVNGVRAGGKRAEIPVMLGTTATITIKAGGRLTQTHKFTPTASNPNIARTFQLVDDLMLPGQRR